MIQINKEKFERVVIAATSSTTEVFDSMGDAISISTERVKKMLFGQMDINKLSPTLTADIERFICLHAFYNAIPGLDLVLTATGFGVVNNQNVSPASRDRVEALRKQVKRASDDACDRIIIQLLGNEEWAATPNARIIVSSLFFTAEELKTYAGKPDACRSDLREIRPVIIEAEEIIRRQISSELHDYLLTQIISDKCTPHESVIIGMLRKAIGLRINKQEAAFKRMLEDTVNFLEQAIEQFPIYENSIAYKVKRFEHYQNEQEDTCFFWG